MTVPRVYGRHVDLGPDTGTVRLGPFARSERLLDPAEPRCPPVESWRRGHGHHRRRAPQRRAALRRLVSHKTIAGICEHALTNDQLDRTFYPGTTTIGPMLNETWFWPASSCPQPTVCPTTSYCCPDAKHCLTPAAPPKACSPTAKCAAGQTCCPLTKSERNRSCVHEPSTAR